MIAARLTDDRHAATVEHRTTWLRQAEATLTSLDPQDGGRLRVLDFAELGAPATGYLGFAAGAELHELARDHLEIGDEITSAVAVNVERIAAVTASDDPGEVSAAVSVVAAHELAHVLDARAGGRRLPRGTTLATVIGSLASDRAREAAALRAGHPPQWLRAYLHLLVRASARPHYGTWLTGFIRDVNAVLPNAPEKYLNALEPEIVACHRQARLVDILRKPAPTGFLSMFHN